MPSFIGAVAGSQRFSPTPYVNRATPTPTAPVTRDQASIGTQKLAKNAPESVGLSRAATIRAQQALRTRPAVTVTPQANPEPQPAITSTPQQTVLPGDVNGDGKVSGVDAKELFNYLFRGGEEPAGLANADRTGDGKLTISDALQILQDILNAEEPVAR